MAFSNSWRVWSQGGPPEWRDGHGGCNEHCLRDVSPAYSLRLCWPAKKFLAAQSSLTVRLRSMGFVSVIITSALSALGLPVVVQ